MEGEGKCLARDAADANVVLGVDAHAVHEEECERGVQHSGFLAVVMKSG
jgi:hypothetical protein